MFLVWRRWFACQKPRICYTIRLVRQSSLYYVMIIYTSSFACLKHINMKVYVRHFQAQMNRISSINRLTFFSLYLICISFSYLIKSGKKIEILYLIPNFVTYMIHMEINLPCNLYINDFVMTTFLRIGLIFYLILIFLKC